MAKFTDFRAAYNPNDQGYTVTWDSLARTLEYLSRQENSNGNDGTGIHPVNACDLDPDFQRPHVWDDERRIAYIEYILRNGVSGRTIYFNRGPWLFWRNRATQEVVREGYAYYVLVDGKQRIEAVTRFMNNEFPIFDGYYFDDFEDDFPHWCFFYFVMGNLKTRAEVLQWYLDINTGGVVHTDSELDRVADLLEAERNR